MGVALVLIVVAGAAAWLFVGESSPRPDDTARRFLAAWSRGDDRGAGARSDRAATATRDLDANRRGLDGARVRATLGAVTEDGDAARAAIHLTWQVPRVGPFEYDSAMRLRRSDDEWHVVWSPKVVHPRLGPHLRLGTTREPAVRGDIVDRDGRGLVTNRAVYRVGLQRDKVKDIAASTAALAEVVDVDRGALARAVRGAGPQQFVEAITLRKSDYAPLEDAIDEVPGALVVAGEAPLSESRGLGRALLGTVGPVTAEQLDELGGTRAPGDAVGQSGLEARYEERLGGTAETRVVIRRDGVPDATLMRKAGRDGRPVRTTLSLGVQRAAEEALGDRDDEAALVAVQPSTGDILAVANRPADSSYDRALEGRYPPGSTFKVVTTAALLARGLRTDEIVDCPRTITVGGRSFKNFEGGAAGAVPFSQDFAQSCNTAFIALTRRLPATALGDAASDFGLGEPLKLGMPAAESQVPPGKDLVARAAAMIGQNETLSSPLAMAGVAATVAAGRWHAPRVLAGDREHVIAPLDPGIRDTLRELTRAVVTGGTGTALADVPGDVHGKSGTAEYGGGDPPPTHAWFIAYRDDVALAVLVENGRSGGSVAAPIAARFFAACDGEDACG